MAAPPRQRRERGEGAITFDASVGLWTGRLDLGRNSEGKRVRVKVSGRTRASFCATSFDSPRTRA